MGGIIDFITGGGDDGEAARREENARQERMAEQARQAEAARMAAEDRRLAAQAEAEKQKQLAEERRVQQRLEQEQLAAANAAKAQAATGAQFSNTSSDKARAVAAMKGTGSSGLPGFSSLTQPAAAGQYQGQSNAPVSTLPNIASTFPSLAAPGKFNTAQTGGRKYT